MLNMLQYLLGKQADNISWGNRLKMILWAGPSPVMGRNKSSRRGPPVHDKLRRLKRTKEHGPAHALQGVNP
jgi:hypothetical protein